MTLSPILSAPDATTVTLDFGVFIAEQARTHRVSQTAIIAALRPCITPSQPEAPSKPHAPAADTPATQAAGDTTDGEDELSSSLPFFPSVEPIPETSDAGAHGGLNDEPSAAVESVPLTTDSPANEGDESDVAPETAQRTIAPDAANGGGQRADAEALGSAVEAGAPSPRMTKREQVRECHEQHPDWTSHQIAEHLGFGVQHIQVMASHLSLKLPRAPRTAPENMRDKVLSVVAAHPDWTLRQIAAEAGCSLGTASKWAKEAAEKPPEAEAPLDEPQAGAEPERLPASTKTEPALPPPPPIGRPVRTTPTGRFYLREKAELGKPVRYVHQSLSPCPTGPGPLMTLDRKWAWFDTMDRYRGALKQWPQITSMLKEAASK